MEGYLLYKKFGKIYVGMLVSIGIVLSGGVAANAEDNLAVESQPRAINIGFVSRTGEATTFDWMLENPTLEDKIGYYKLSLRVDKYLNKSERETTYSSFEIEKTNKSVTVDIPQDSIAYLNLSTYDTKGKQVGGSDSFDYTPAYATPNGLPGIRGSQSYILSVRPLDNHKANKNEVLVEWQPPAEAQYRNAISGYEVGIPSINGSGFQSLKKTGTSTLKAIVDLNKVKKIVTGAWYITVATTSLSGRLNNSQPYMYNEPQDGYYAPCPDIQLIAARGSDEPLQDDDGTVIKGSEEQTLLTNEQITEELPGYVGLINGGVETIYAQNLKQEITKKINPKTDKPYTFDTYAVPYPAVKPVIGDAFDWSTEQFWVNNIAFGQSVNTGSEMTSNKIEKVRNICPNTKIVLSGYSQGALVMGDTLDALSKEDTHVDSVILFGDPFFNPLDISDRSNYSTFRAGMLAERALWEDVTMSPVASYCHDLDVFCNITDNTGLLNPIVPAEAARQNNGNFFAPHESYPRNWEPDNNLQATQEAAVETVKQLQLK